MKIKSLICLAALAAPLTVHADFLSVSAGAGVWNTSPTGNINKTSLPANVSLKDDLFWSDESQGYLFATLEHPVPILPNVRVMATKIDQSGEGNTSFTFDGTTYNGNVTNDFKIETLDLIAYYEILDNVVNLDFGLNIRNLSIDYSITGTPTTGPSISNSDTSSATIPMLYVLVGASPLPDLIISGELSYISLSGSSISDFTAKVAYTTSFFVGFEAGYRKQQYTLDDVSDTNADISFDGIFAGAYLKF